MSDNQLIYAVPRNKGEKIEIRLRQFQGKRFIDVRLWFQLGPQMEYKPSRKGICLSLQDLKQFRIGIEEACKTVAALQTQGEKHTNATQ